MFIDCVCHIPILHPCRWVFWCLCIHVRSVYARQIHDLPPMSLLWGLFLFTVPLDHIPRSLLMFHTNTHVGGCNPRTGWWCWFTWYWYAWYVVGPSCYPCAHTIPSLGFPLVEGRSQWSLPVPWNQCSSGRKDQDAWFSEPQRLKVWDKQTPVVLG